MTRHWPFAHLQMFGYDLVLADPPWSYEMYAESGYEKSPEAHYATMADDELLNLPVGDLASSTCTLIMWAVWPKLPLAQACMKRWGFRHVTGGSWIKTTKDGTALRIGTGYTFRSACEPYLVGRIGPPLARLTDVPNVIIAPGREHSRKPHEMREIAERMTPRSRRCELFARETWPGNDVWGNDTSKFEVQA